MECSSWLSHGQNFDRESNDVGGRREVNGASVRSTYQASSHKQPHLGSWRHTAVGTTKRDVTASPPVQVVSRLRDKWHVDTRPSKHCAACQPHSRQPILPLPLAVAPWLRHRQQESRVGTGSSQPGATLPSGVLPLQGRRRLRNRAISAHPRPPRPRPPSCPLPAQRRQLPLIAALIRDGHGTHDPTAVAGKDCLAAEARSLAGHPAYTGTTGSWRAARDCSRSRMTAPLRAAQMAACCSEWAAAVRETRRRHTPPSAARGPLAVLGELH